MNRKCWKKGFLVRETLLASASLQAEQRKAEQEKERLEKEEAETRGFGVCHEGSISASVCF